MGQSSSHVEYGEHQTSFEATPLHCPYQHPQRHERNFQRPWHLPENTDNDRCSTSTEDSWAGDNESEQGCATADSNATPGIEEAELSRASVTVQLHSLATFAYQQALRCRMSHSILARGGEYNVERYTSIFVHDCLMLPGSMASLLNRVRYIGLDDAGGLLTNHIA